jgi:predicted secreted acid phosphatase
MNRLSRSLVSALVVILSVSLASPAQASYDPVVPITVPGSPTPVRGVLQGLPALTAAPGTEYDAGSAFATQIEEYRDTGQYQRDQRLVARAAQRFTASWIREHCRTVRDCDGRKAAIVFDIDDTLLDWYPTYLSTDFAYDQALNAQVGENCLTPAIAPTVAFYTWARKRGIATFLITGRPVAGRAVAVACLRERGIAEWDGLTMRQPNQMALTAAVYKARARAVIEASGYRIVTSTGDQLSDMMGGGAVMGFRLPNPMYYIP